MSKIGENIKRLRQMTTVTRTMTQMDLANKTGIQSTAISHYEHGRNEPSLGNLIKLADALGVSIDELIKGSFHD